MSGLVDGPLTGRTALVTGGGNGLGAAIARALHGHGADVVLAGRRPEPLAAVCDELGPGATWHACDVADPDSVAALASSLAGTDVSILINNAGIAGPVAGPRMERNFTLEAQRTGRSYDEAMDAFVSRAALGRMVTEGEVGAAVIAMLAMPGMCGADIDLSAGMVA